MWGLVSIQHGSTQTVLLLIFTAFSLYCGGPPAYYGSGRIMAGPAPKSWWYLSLDPGAELSSSLSQVVFAVCVDLLEVSLQVKGAKMDECPSGGYNKARKQQLCDSEYHFSLSWSQSISATLITHKKISHSDDMAVTTSSTALWLCEFMPSQFVCLFSGWSPVAVEQWATQPDVHRDSWAGRVSEPDLGATTATTAKSPSWWPWVLQAHLQ